MSVTDLPSFVLGLLTGPPGEEVNTFGGNLLKELSVVHEKSLKAMKNMVKVLWLTEVVLDDMA